MASICRFVDEKMEIRNQDKKDKFECKRHVKNFHGNPNKCFNNFILRQHFKRISSLDHCYNKCDNNDHKKG